MTTANHDRMSGNEGQIAEFYRGRHILVTGATGFMGKVLVQKLLYSCPNLEKIYLLMREKRGQDVSKRLEKLTSAAIFDSLRKNHAERLEKLVAMTGDITQPELGLSEEDQRTLQANVSVVFHSAATVKFDEALKLSVAMNLQGTKTLTQLCLNMPKLEAFVHVSTAYCNCDRSEVHEVVYAPPADPEKIMQLVESLDEDILDSMTDKIIKNRPNTYTFTKALAEHVLLKQSARLPIAIIRPSIVTASWKEPLPGWVDNLNGPTGLLAGAGKGVLRTIMCHREKVADIIPVDMAINLMITVAWHTATTRPNRLVVYNCTSGVTNPIYWRNIESWGHEYLVKHPFSGVLWYPGGSFKSSRLLNSLCVYVFHLAPACVLDAFSLLTGQKPIMLKIHKKLQRAVTCLEYFTTNEWKFMNDNMAQLMKEMHPADREKFNFNISDLNWKTYIESYVLGTRKYILKEDPSTIDTAKVHLRRMYWAHRLSQMVIFALMWQVVRSGKLTALGYNLLSQVLHLIKPL
ncbi:putative fatty acyl-CoA reductase CG5065 isoform X1 [Macrosteles quadrilineatus]|uniref:putative fatty acyl-CoA reductase CG5065 isoform X1 n=1 Tax=Macrosteles quadrilineatus TaxID=74068 RepID=UPI0023E11E3B|nr:putative fatty acyl-CoA reductase CG5065 isoform X1 [Macrosteles quadrilineatus]